MGFVNIYFYTPPDIGMYIKALIYIYLHLF